VHFSELLVAAKLKRDLKLSELQLKKRPLARKQSDQVGIGHEVAKPRLHRNDHRSNQFRATVSVNTNGKSARHLSAALFPPLPRHRPVTVQLADFLAGCKQQHRLKQLLRSAGNPNHHYSSRNASLDLTH
jgi:hypothetical protein